MWWLVGIIVLLIFVVYMSTSGLSDADKFIAARVAALTTKISTTAAEVKKQSSIAVDNADAATKNLAAAAFDKVAANATAASTASSNATAGVVDLQDLMTQYQALAIKMTDLKTKAAYNLDIAAKNKLVTQAQSNAQAAADAAVDAQKAKTAADNAINNTVSIIKPSTNAGGSTASGINNGIGMGTNFNFVATTGYGSAGTGAVAGSTGSMGAIVLTSADVITTRRGSMGSMGSTGGGSITTGAAQSQLTVEEIALLVKLSAIEKTELTAMSISDQKLIALLMKTFIPISTLKKMIDTQDRDIANAYMSADTEITRHYIYSNLINYSNAINSTSSSIEANITNMKSQVAGFASLLKSFKNSGTTSVKMNEANYSMVDFLSDTNLKKDSANSILLRSQTFKTQIADLIARAAVANKFQKNYIKGGTRDKSFTLGLQKDELACQQALIDKYPMPDPIDGVSKPTAVPFGFGYTYVPSTNECNVIFGVKMIRRTTRYRADPNDPASLLYGAMGYDTGGYIDQKWDEDTIDCSSHCTTPDCAWMVGAIPSGSVQKAYCTTKTLAAKDATDTTRYMPDEAISRMRIDMTPLV